MGSGTSVPTEDTAAAASAGPDEAGSPRRRRSKRSARTTEAPRAASAKSSERPPSRRPPSREDEPRYEVEDSPSSRKQSRADEAEGKVPSTRGPSRWPPGTPMPTRYRVAFDENNLDPDVLKVIRRLVRHRFEAYLVGGCVRDLLLGRRPKDFDVTTDARPEEVRNLFRNSRIIGRRFRLVHVLFGGGKVIEVATFRRSPETSEEERAVMIRSDNAFGHAHEDALRRDFTINGLFYDDASGEVLDWVGGIEDLKGRVVNTIGDPETRFREDPVRILRALKFAGRLELGMTPEVYEAIVYCRDTLHQAARPRVGEEVLRLLRGGQARRTIFLAWETGVLDELLPELSALIYDDDGDEGPARRVWDHLRFIDHRVANGRHVDDITLWTLLLLEAMKEASDGARDRTAAVAEFLEPISERLNVPRRIVDAMRRIVAVLPKLAVGKAGRFSRTDLFPVALDVAEADALAMTQDTSTIDSLRKGEAPLKRRGGRRRRSG